MMQSGGRYDIGRNQMVSIIPAGGASAYIGGSSDEVMTDGDSTTFVRLKSDAYGHYTEETEECKTIEPTSTDPHGKYTGYIGEEGKEYYGNTCIRGYNFLIEDISDQMLQTSGQSGNGQWQKLAVSMKTLKDVKDGLEEEIATIIGQGDAYLTRSDAEITYESISAHNSDKSALESSISTKANSADVYTKSQVDSSLSSKANASDVYTKAESDTALALKADQSTTYTKTETDSALSAKANSADVYTKSQVYTKPETYSNTQVEDRILTLTTFENQGQDIAGYYTERVPVYDPETGEIIGYEDVQVPIYDNQTESTCFWDTRTGCYLVKTAVKQALSIPGQIIKRIFIEPKMKRIRTACLAATGALVGSKVVAQSLAFGVTSAIACTHGGDDDPGDIEFDDDYHGSRTVTNMVHDSEYNSMTYTEDGQTHSLTPDSTIPTTQAIKNHHYTKTEVDSLIAGIPGPDMSNYYNKSESDARFINVDEPVTLLGKSFEIQLQSTKDISVTTSTSSTLIHTIEAEGKVYHFEYKNVCAWNTENRRPIDGDMTGVHFVIRARITGKEDQEFECTFSDYYSGILNDAHYTNTPCDYFFDISCSGVINCDIGDGINFYFVTYADSIPNPPGSYTGSTESASEGHPKYLKGLIETSIDNYYTKYESDDKYLQMINSTSDRRIFWDGGNLKIQAYVNDAWATKFQFAPASAKMSTGRLYFSNSGSLSGDSVSEIATSATASLSTSDTTIATPGYINQYYVPTVNSTNDRRVMWDTDGNLLIQTYANDAWNTRIKFRPNVISYRSFLTIGSIYFSSVGSTTGTAISGVSTASSTLSTSDTTIATPGYVDQFYQPKPRFFDVLLGSDDFSTSSGAQQAIIQFAAEANDVIEVNVSGSFNMSSLDDVSKFMGAIKVEHSTDNTYEGAIAFSHDITTSNRFTLTGVLKRQMAATASSTCQLKIKLKRNDSTALSFSSARIRVAVTLSNNYNALAYTVNPQ